MHGDFGIWGWTMMAGMTFVWISFFVVIAWAATASLRSKYEPTTPLDALKESYARGRITREEFDQAKKDLA